MRALTLLATLCSSGLALAAPGDVTRGATAYQNRCSQCHGQGGKADGPAAHTMMPRPRVFAGNSAYKFRTTASGELPTDQDLFNIVERGIPGTSMPSFARVAPEERWDIIAYIKSLNEDFADPDMVKTAVTMPELSAAKPTKSSAESIARGKELYQSNKCWQCHGQNGRGNGPSFNELFDNWGKTPILPADLTNPASFRGGHEPFDLFRTITAGLTGTPMPAYQESITVEDRWHLINYILSLSPAPKADPDEMITATKIDGAIPGNDDQEFWQKQPASRFKTFPNVIEPPRLFWPSVEFVDAQAAYNQNELVLRVAWNDRSQSKGTNVAAVYKDGDGTIHRATDHPDQFVVQLPALGATGGPRPYFLLGDGKRPTNLWWWRADRNKTVEMNGKGSGALSYQSLDSQELQATVTYDDGRYTMIARRPLSTGDTKNDAQLSLGQFVPVAFQVWDGSRGEVGTRRSVTAWYWLHLRPAVPTKSYVTPPIAFVLTLGLLVGLARWTKKKG
jgi:DMSO reductase family type II enzyme heme b subunit